MAQRRRVATLYLCTISLLVMLSCAALSSAIVVEYDPIPEDQDGGQQQYSSGCYSSDIPLGFQYIIAYDDEVLVQTVEYTNPSSSDVLKIDCFEISDEGMLQNSWVEQISLYADGGNGFFDGGGSSTKKDDVRIATVSSPNLMGGQLIGGNDSVACCTVRANQSRRFFLTLDIKNEVKENNIEIKTKIDATDLTSGSTFWFRAQGIDTATDSAELFSAVIPDRLEAYDADDDGVVDEIQIDADFPIGPCTSMWHLYSESTSIANFDVTCDGGEVDVESIVFVESNESSLSFRLFLDEFDPDLVSGTNPPSSPDFDVSYDDEFASLVFENAQGQVVAFASVFWFLEVGDAVSPSVVGLEVSDTLLVPDDAGNVFVVSAEFNEPMDTSKSPVFEFDVGIDSGSSAVIDFNSGFWSDQKTYYANYSVIESERYASGVDVTCTVEGCFDDSGNQLDSPVTMENVCDVEMKAPVISDWPSGALTPGYEYTVRVTVIDDSQISSVVLDYDFGAGLNTKPMSLDPGSGQYVAVVLTPESADDLMYRVTAVDVYDNMVVSSFYNLSVPVVDDSPDDPSNQTGEGGDNDPSDGSGDSSGDTTDSSSDDSSDDSTDDLSAGGQQQTPGFEAVVLCVALVVVLFVLRRRKN